MVFVRTEQSYMEHICGAIDVVWLQLPETSTLSDSRRKLTQVNYRPNLVYPLCTANVTTTYV